MHLISDIISKTRKGVNFIEISTNLITAAKASLDKKARDVLLLEIKGLTSIADHFIICSGESATQIKAIAEHIKETLKKIGLRPKGIEGLSFARWVLMDYGDFIIHIFDEETRAYYELEKLWIDAPRLFISDETIKKLSSNSKNDAQ